MGEDSDKKMDALEDDVFENCSQGTIYKTGKSPDVNTKSREDVGDEGVGSMSPSGEGGTGRTPRRFAVFVGNLTWVRRALSSCFWFSLKICEFLTIF